MSDLPGILAPYTRTIFAFTGAPADVLNQLFQSSMRFPEELLTAQECLEIAARFPGVQFFGFLVGDTALVEGLCVPDDSLTDDDRAEIAQDNGIEWVKGKSPDEIYRDTIQDVEYLVLRWKIGLSALTEA